jgi:hypothetical protein
MAKDDQLDAARSVDEDAGCIRCDGRLIFLGKKDFHEGTRAWGFIFGDFGELLTGGEEIAMFACEECGHVEFFIPPK